MSLSEKPSSSCMPTTTHAAASSLRSRSRASRSDRSRVPSCFDCFIPARWNRSSYGSLDDRGTPKPESTPAAATTTKLRSALVNPTSASSASSSLSSATGRPRAAPTFIEPAAIPGRNKPTRCNAASAASTAVKPLPPLPARRSQQPPCAALSKRRVPRSSLPTDVPDEAEEESTRYIAPRSDVWLCSRPNGGPRLQAPVLVRSTSSSSASSGCYDDDNDEDADVAAGSPTYLSTHRRRKTLERSPSLQGLTTSDD